jgi:hypothetical protein
MLTFRQQRMARCVVELLKEGHAEERLETDAAVKAGYSEVSAATSAYHNRLNPEYQAYLKQKMGDAGFTPEKLEVEDPDSVSEVWIIRGLKALAQSARSEAVKATCFAQLGKYWRLNMWDESRKAAVEPLKDRQALLERIENIVGNIGLRKLLSALQAQRPEPLPGGTEAARGEEQNRRTGADPDAGGIHIGRLGEQAVFGGDGERENVGDGGGRGLASDGRAPATETGKDDPPAHKREGDGSQPDGQRGQRPAAGDDKVVAAGLHR